MFTNDFVKKISSVALIGIAALLIAGAVSISFAQTSNVQSKDYPTVKDATPDGKDCYKYKGKRYCVKPEGSSKIAAPSDPQALRECFWVYGPNGIKRLACIYY